MSRALLEACSSVRPIVTTDGAGCRDVSGEGVRDAGELADQSTGLAAGPRPCLSTGAASRVSAMPNSVCRASAEQALGIDRELS